MNYPQILTDINNWKGCEKEYWKAVEILIKANKLTEGEEKLLKRGLTHKSESVVNEKIQTLKEEITKKYPKFKTTEEKKEEPKIIVDEVIIPNKKPENKKESKKDDKENFSD